MVPIRRRLKTGAEVTIRPMAPADVDDLLSLERAIAAAGDGVVMTPEDLQETAALRKNLVAASYRPLYSGVRLVALASGGVVGTASIQRLRPGLCRHVATLAAGVAPGLRDLGLGKALVARAIEWVESGAARAPPPVSRVELSVRADNPRAIALYERFHFAVEARRRGYVRTPEGALIDDYIMVRGAPSGDRDGGG